MSAIGSSMCQSEARQQADDVGLHHDLVVLGAEALRDLPGVGQLVVEGLGGAAREPDRVRPHRMVAVLRHQADDGARVDPAREEAADRHVAHHLHAHRVVEARADALGPLGFGDAVVDRVGDAPVALRAHLARFGDEHRRGRKLLDAAEDRLRRRHVAEAHVRIERVRIQLGAEAGQREDRLRLAREHQPLAVAVDVERLDAEPIAPDQQPPAARVPEREGVHAVQVTREVVAVLGVEMQDRLAVGAGLEPVAARLEVAAQLAEVVDLAVRDEPQRAVGVRERLVAARRGR